jgi:aryl sulfotransferase
MRAMVDPRLEELEEMAGSSKVRYRTLIFDSARWEGFADRLGIEVAEHRWPELVLAATFDAMRDNADRIAPDTTNAIWLDNGQFFHRGISGQWRDLLDDDGLARYASRVAAIAEPQVASWMHRPPLDA